MEIKNGYMLVEIGSKINSQGYIVLRRGSGDTIPVGYDQVEGTNSCKTQGGAIRKRNSILKNRNWKYNEGTIKIAKFEVLDY